MNFRDVFFMTFPSFAKPEDVLTLLEKRIVESQNTPEECSQIILRAVASIKSWVEYYPEDFEVGTEIRQRTENFTESVISKIVPGATSILYSVLPKKIDEEIKVQTRSRSLRSTGPAIAIDDYSVLEPGRICFAALNSLEVARQLTNMTCSIFLKLKPQELARKNWTRDEKHILSPNVMQIVEQFNKVNFF